MRELGFYWIKVYGRLIVAEWTKFKYDKPEPGVCYRWLVPGDDDMIADNCITWISGYKLYEPLDAP